MISRKTEDGGAATVLSSKESFSALFGLREGHDGFIIKQLTQERMSGAFEDDVASVETALKDWLKNNQEFVDIGLKRYMKLLHQGSLAEGN